MKITLVTDQPPGKKVNKDYNAGLGTGFLIGNGIRAKILEAMRMKMEALPFLTFGYLAAIFQKNGHEVKATVNKLPEEGLVIMAPSLVNFNADMKLIKEAKSRGLKVGVVGTLVTVMPELFDGECDFLVIGEPEDFALNLKTKLPVGRVQSPLVANLDSLPFPAWEVFQFRNQSYYLALKEKPFTFIQTSRSCPYECGYCPYIVETKYRKRGIKNVIEEMRYLKEKLNIRGLVFRDPTFSLSKNRTMDLCNAMIKEKFDFSWVCETRLDCLDEELITTMKAAGLKSIKIGVESADEDVLKQANRIPIQIQHQEKMIRFCDKIGIKVIAFYILALPADTEETILETLKYAKRMNTYVAQFHICTPLPGTAFYHELKDKITETDWEKFNNFEVVFKHDNLSREKILSLKEKAYGEYYFRPGYIWSFIKTQFWQ